MTRRTITFITAIFLASVVLPQSPQKISYQAVIRDADGNLVTNQVRIRISVLEGGSAGIPVFVETHLATPNDKGLASVEIGGGAPVTGSLAEIDWSAASFYIKTQTDPSGGTNYTIEGTSQILSVPYALYAKTAGGHYTGQLFGGGIVVSVWKTAGVEHGLIASLEDISAGTKWSDVSLVSGAVHALDGQFNTNKIMLQGPTEGAVLLCNNYTNAETGTGIFSDWYLPAIWELKECYNSEFVINSILGTNGFLFGNYWSSTEDGANTAWYMNFSTGTTYTVGVKNNYPASSGAVRAVRIF